MGPNNHIGPHAVVALPSQQQHLGAGTHTRGKEGLFSVNPELVFLVSGPPLGAHYCLVTSTGGRHSFVSKLGQWKGVLVHCVQYN